MNTQHPLETWRLPSRSISEEELINIVFKEVAGAFGYSFADLHTRDRHQRIAWARQVAMALLVETGRMSLAHIGRLLNRSHQTVAHAVKVVENLTSAYTNLAKEIDAIRSSVSRQIAVKH